MGGRIATHQVEHGVLRLSGLESRELSQCQFCYLLFFI